MRAATVAGCEGKCSSWSLGFALLLGLGVTVVWFLEMNETELTREEIQWKLVLAVPVVGLLSLPAAHFAVRLRFSIAESSFEEAVAGLTYRLVLIIG